MTLNILLEVSEYESKQVSNRKRRFAAGGPT
jgi:hypothetical protein